MPDLRTWFQKPRLFLVIAATVVIVLGAALAAGLVITQAAPPQPFPYNHAVHIKDGVQCMYCHTGAARGIAATLPTLAKCQGCHSNMLADTPALKQWVEYSAKHDKIEWTPVAIMPDFVYFSHQPHIAGGVNCETCHGDVSNMADAKPRSNWNMGWCLDCHKKQAPEKIVKLTDCATCHK